MSMSESIHVKIPYGLQARAREAGLNLSAISRKAITEAVLKLEEPKKPGTPPSNLPAVAIPLNPDSTGCDV